MSSLTIVLQNTREQVYLAEKSKRRVVLINAPAEAVRQIHILRTRDDARFTSQRSRVIATASSRDAEYVRGLGAEKVLEYQSTRFEEVLTSVDAVIMEWWIPTMPPVSLP